ncbi:hypothetical protein FRACYDRAFT_243799 [Fragilariopsis cylindrus CCMP1102]|uniref:Uncharacterized protein n=1 Tax=Fragilariopsis cylindrus CCMP1102 TaxID=635003 RepID=A0A1E7F334_9STRA|nr:hypothetical protein FRACYDRAFT_243799 [Fragilariopsis cylindrus CCMP1102]|eukprot:OEU12547.1 hypothetical protein FRACYDRAFT_243799 [Fragilariopsis cylindrus CCMP1102]
MRFSGGALAILGASNDGTTDRHRTGRHHRSSMMSSSSSSATPPITNRTTNRQQQTGAVTTSAITNLQRLREIVECDPTTPSSGNALTEERRLRGRGSNTNSEYHDGTSKMTANTKDDDFGILDRSKTNSFITFTSACGVGRKCQDVSTSTSKSSGLCVDVEGWNHRNLQQKGSAGTSENDIYGDAFATGKLDEMQYLCDYGDLVGYDCECNFNENDYTGSGACNITDTGNDEFCTTTTSMCDVSIENCYSSTYRVTLVPSSSSSSDATGSWDAEVCSHFSEPYGQTVCYTTRNTITSSDNNDAEEATTSSRNPYGCSISIDGETCTSCEIAESRSNDDDEGTCYVFDCRNTQAGMNGISKVGNTCDYPVFPLSLYLDTYETDYPVGNITDISEGPDETDVPSDAFDGPDGTDAPSHPVTEPPVIINQEEIDDGAFIDEPSVLDTGLYEATAENDDISSRNDVTNGDNIDRTSTINNDEEDDAEQEQVDDIDVYSMNNYCSPCGPKKKVLSSKYDDNEVSIPTQGIFTCKELNEVAKQRSFNPICSLVQLAANVPCGCNDYDEEEHVFFTTATATKSADTDTDADADASSSSSTTSVDSTAFAAAAASASGTAMNHYTTFFILGVVTSMIMSTSLSL